jgi:5-deoxy-D-glucuronate isomerase
MAYDNSIRKQLLPVDARGLRGVFSRGKAQYGKFANAPHIGRDFNHQVAAQKRLRKGVVSGPSNTKRSIKKMAARRIRSRSRGKHR